MKQNNGVVVGGDDDEKTILKLLAIPTIIVLLIILFIPVGLFNAWAMQKMYIWFLLPLGLPALNLWHIWGISLIINHYIPTGNTDENWKKGIGRIIGTMIGTLLMLAIGLVLRGHIG